MEEIGNVIQVTEPEMYHATRGEVPVAGYRQTANQYQKCSTFARCIVINTNKQIYNYL